MSKGNGFSERVLANGLRVIVEPMANVRSAAAGFLVRTGARDEVPELAGVSHFLEHMCFKGTPNRDWRQITVDFDKLGSTYNAYTSKERTVYFGWVRADDLEKQIELLADMMQSVIPSEEFDMEKKVILEEIAMSDDQLDRHVYDFIHERIHAGHPLAWPVLGTAQTVGDLTRDRMRAYFDERYHAGNMVLIVAGAIEAEAAFAMAERVCGDRAGGSARPERTAPPLPGDGTAVQQMDRFQQQAVALIFAGPSSADKDREAASVLASILGGHNSRFYWNIVQAGVAPYVWAGRLDYSDHGLLVVCGFCEPDRAEAVFDAMRREIKNVVDSGVTDDEVQMVKNRVRTGLAAESESPYHRLTQMMQDIDVLGNPRTVSERLARIDAVTAASIRDHLIRWPMNDPGFLVSVGPRDWPA